MELPVKRWIKIALFNLLIVAALGVILRYKIVFYLPFVNQKYLLHGHSHFAFTGWITQALMVLMVHYLHKNGQTNSFKRYNRLLYGNLISAYGMLVLFPLLGYAFGPIFFSTLSIVVSYFFAVYYWRDLGVLPFKSNAHLWFKAALVFNALSSLGAFGLAFMMANKIVHETWYLGAVYFFLHFQYNGWFFFAIMGLMMSAIHQVPGLDDRKRMIFWLFSLSCVPAFFLSALWMQIPTVVYWLVVASAIAQLAGWILLVKLLVENKKSVLAYLPKKARVLLLLSAIALSIKLLLQLGSTHPALSQLAFGFRPIVIGYLHLVLLGIITIFILGYIVTLGVLTVNKYFMNGVWIFIAGIFANELLLMLQGITGLFYVIVPLVNELLFAAALLLFTGITVLNMGIIKTTEPLRQNTHSKASRSSVSSSGILPSGK